MRKKFLAISLTLAIATSILGCNQGKAVENPTVESSVSEAGESTEAASKDSGKEKETEAKTKTLEELKAEGKTYYYSQDGLTDAAYFINEDFEIVTENGTSYFNYAPDKMIEKANAIISEKSNEPHPYLKVTAEELGVTDVKVDYSYYANDLDMLILVKGNDDNTKIEHIVIGGTSSVAPDKDSPLSTIAIQSAFVVCAIDPNMIPQYAAMAMVDVAMAGMITYSDDAYAYTSEIGQVGYGVLKLSNMINGEDFYAIAIVPLDKIAE